jgi:predicted ATPase/class 3 adenylate cyclase
MAGDLPSGLVTFVLTDIEGSTRLLKQLGEGYPPLLERHRELLRSAWDKHGGVEVKTEGDGCIVAFSSAADALQACVAAQQALGSEPWPANAAVRVRMGTHTGVAFPRHGDYVALALHQAARVVGAGHGGQILATEDVVASAGDGVDARRLGMFRLRDFERPTLLFDIRARGETIAPSPPLRAVPADGHNLVAPPTTFLGRGEELGAIRARLAPGRLVTVVGAGGMGKTRLAIELGLRVARAWSDGVWMVDLTSVQDEAQVASALADSVAAPAGEGDDLVRLISHLREWWALLIVDNCEHLVAAAAAAVHAVLNACPQVGVLATSREPLGLAGEELWRLGPLGVDHDAVQLFADRARSARPSFDLDPERDAVLEICRRVDGMPLALELAAARIAVLSPREIVDGLRSHSNLLRNRDPTAPVRQRTIAALLDWSHDLLNSHEQAALRRVSVFAGSFGLDAVAACVGWDDIDESDVPDLVWSLAAKSLVTVDRGAGSTRYRLLETVRAYAQCHLDAADDGPATRAALADWYLDHFPLADRGKHDWRSRIALELDTMLTLAEHLAAASAGDEALAIALLVAEFWIGSGQFHLSLDWTERVLARDPLVSTMTARLRLCAAWLASNLGLGESAGEHLLAAEHLVASAGAVDRYGRLSIAAGRAHVLVRLGTPEARAEAEALLRGELLVETDPVARRDMMKALALTLALEQSPEAEAAYLELLEQGRAEQDSLDVAWAAANLAEIELRRGDRTAAAAHQLESLQCSAELGLSHTVAFSMIVAARLAASDGSDAMAVRLHGAADGLLDEGGFRLYPEDRVLSDSMLALARERLGDDRFAEEYEYGRAAPFEESFADATHVLGRVACADRV